VENSTPRPQEFERLSARPVLALLQAQSGAPRIHEHWRGPLADLRPFDPLLSRCNVWKTADKSIEGSTAEPSTIHSEKGDLAGRIVSPKNF
jgi:hypothetical protein